jgi:hypothetical protein
LRETLETLARNSAKFLPVIIGKKNAATLAPQGVYGIKT